MSAPPPSAAAITPAPSEEEAAAIVAAIDAMWPRPAQPVLGQAASVKWRFSGRWWHRSASGRGR